MNYFDLHCDTLGECLRTKDSLYHNRGQLSVDKGSFDRWVQCFAIWIPDEVRGWEAVALVENAGRFLQEECERHQEKMLLYKKSGDLVRAVREGKLCAVFTVEGGGALGGDLKNVERFARLGVKMITLTWNGPCELGDGTDVSRGRGLTSFGKTAVMEMERLGIAIDISHAGESLFWDTAQVVSGPLVASHSNAQHVCSHRRNLSDEQIQELLRRRGLIGLNFHRPFLEEDPERANFFSIIRQAEYFLSLGCQDILAIGSDFDGAQMPKDLGGIDGIPALYELFLKENYSEETVRKIFFENARIFFDRTGIIR